MLLFPQCRLRCFRRSSLAVAVAVAVAVVAVVVVAVAVVAVVVAGSSLAPKILLRMPRSAASSCSLGSEARSQQSG